MIYSIADMIVDLEFKHEYGIKKCEKYLSEGSPVFSANATEKEVSDELLKFPENTAETAEFDCVFRKLYNFAPKMNRMLIHGAAIMIDGKGFLFTAPSGTGKSTHIKLWRKRYGSRVTIIDGDKPFVGIKDGKAYVWGSPRCGKEGWNNPISATLCGIAYLTRSKVNRIEKVLPFTMAEKIFSQCYIPKSKDTALLTINMINVLMSSVPIYNLYCNMEQEAAEVAFTGLSLKTKT